MKPTPTRRSFLSTAAAAAAAGAVGLPIAGAAAGAPAATVPPNGPVAVASGNGLRAVSRAVELILAGEDTLEAVVSGVEIVENDPDDMSVGYGGLPNEAGVVELDACCMHGPSQRAGAVAAIQMIRNPARVAQRVLARTDHVLIVGQGAQDFAVAHGFKKEDLLTEKAREAWLRWKESLSSEDDWLTAEEAKAGAAARPTGTINCLAVNEQGEISGVTTTSGLAFKIPGRVGDSPIIGAGLYVDNEVGAAGATGRGEAVILASGSRIICENMRHGMDPSDAILDVLRRIASRTVDPRLRDGEGRPRFDVTLYALRKDGAYAGGSLWSGRKIAVKDGGEARLEDCLFLFESKS
jgi:N4-(beta-N-acetylglucosaminyl)-L-asparaginase